MDVRPKTIFCDIDGTLVKHCTPTETTKPEHKMELIEGSISKLQEWDAKGYNIILTTGRKESLRIVTEKQLQDVGIIYDKLIMGIGGGERILINDAKPNGKITARAFCIERDNGISDIEI